MSSTIDQEVKIDPSDDSEKAPGLELGGNLDSKLGQQLESPEDPSEVLDKCFQQIGFGRYQWVS